MPGSIPDHAWDHWRRFAAIAARDLDWRPADARAWRTANATDWSPAYETVSEGERLLIIQHDWHGFPDPPEWALHVAEGAPPKAKCLGCFDDWPPRWRGQAK